MVNTTFFFAELFLSQSVDFKPNSVLFYKATGNIPLQCSPIINKHAGTEAQVCFWVLDANEHGGYRETTPKTYNTHYYNVHSVTVHT